MNVSTNNTHQFGTSDSSMDAMSERAERLIGAISGALMSTAETAAMKIELAAQVAQIRQEMAARQSVLGIIADQKLALLEQVEESTGALKLAYQRQVEVLCAQEVGILKGMGIETEVAEQAVSQADENDQNVPVNRLTHVNGNGHSHEDDDDPHVIRVAAHTRKKGKKAKDT